MWVASLAAFDAVTVFAQLGMLGHCLAVSAMFTAQVVAVFTIVLSMFAHVIPSVLSHCARAMRAGLKSCWCVGKGPRAFPTHQMFYLLRQSVHADGYALGAYPAV